MSYRFLPEHEHVAVDQSRGLIFCSGSPCEYLANWFRVEKTDVKPIYIGGMSIGFSVLGNIYEIFRISEWEGE